MPVINRRVQGAVDNEADLESSGGSEEMAVQEDEENKDQFF